MLDSVDASRFDRAMAKGRTCPLLIAGEHSDHSEVELVAKFSAGNGLGVEGLTREVFGSLLALDLGLHSPEPFLVRTSAAFIEQVATTDSASAQLLRDSVAVGFGSKRLPSGYTAWMPAQITTKSQLQQAIEVFAFDALFQNSDRYRPDNPNLQFRGDALAIFDHELAFFTEGVLGWQPPWVTGSLAGIGQPSQHVLFASVRGRMHDLSRFEGALQAISDVRLGEYRMALPAEWAQARTVADRAVQLIGDIRNNIGLCVQELQRVLA